MFSLEATLVRFYRFKKICGFKLVDPTQWHSSVTSTPLLLWLNEYQRQENGVHFTEASSCKALQDLYCVTKVYDCVRVVLESQLRFVKHQFLFKDELQVIFLSKTIKMLLVQLNFVSLSKMILGLQDIGIDIGRRLGIQAAVRQIGAVLVTVLKLFSY